MAIISKPYVKLFEVIENSSCYQEMPYDIRSSVLRFFEFIGSYYSVRDVSLLNKNHLISYLKHHNSKKFSDREFTAVIKDIKNVIIFLNKLDIYKRKIHLDVSLQNILLWVSL